MDLYINGRFLERPVTGVERYGREVLRRLGVEFTVLRPGRGRRGLVGHLWEQVVLPARVPAGGLLWSPANTGPLRAPRQVLTLHDLAALDHPEWFQPRFALWYAWLLPRLARRATRLLTVSRFSRDRIVARLGVPESRVDVVPPGVGPPFGAVPTGAASAAPARHGLEGPFLLTVGTLEPRKNLATVLAAWRRAAPRLPGVSLVVVGEKGPAFRRVRPEVPVERVRWLGRVPDADLAALYAAALGLVYVPLYEGFGLPPLEAMACGCPVLASPAGGLPEAVGEAALLASPERSEEVAEGMLRLAGDEDLRRRLREAGRERARKFTWEATAAAVRRSLEVAWQT